MPQPTSAISPNVTRRELGVDVLPRQDGRAPDYAYQLQSQPGNLTVSVLNYGERQPGAETVHVQFSRPIEGCTCLSTTNGIATFSPSGTRLLLHDLFAIIAIDAHTMKAWHYVLPARTLFLAADWDAELVTGSTLAYGRPTTDAIVFGPWSWEQLVSTWRTGLGEQLTMSPNC